ncbi:acetolactate synthase large subunit [Enterovirga rhinocerotis]|nr:acetolactate synthase large subunit [Enterovirga rhinocerotis]
MNGAESLVRTLVGGGVEVAFTNPGTSEMHFVAALDRVDGMRCVLCLFEGGATGAADGYGRMAEKPASTLLHCGPGLGNGLANLHNARRSRTPIVNIVGDHATYHLQYDAPLTSDIEGIARPVSAWVRTSPDSRRVAQDGAEAIAAARTAPGGVATLILPADTAWGEGGAVATVPAVPEREKADPDRMKVAVEALMSGEPTLLFLGDRTLREEGLGLAERICAKTGAKMMAQTSNARIERGAGRVPIERLPYPVDAAIAVLKGLKHLVVIGTTLPVGFFAYPGKPSLLTPPDCTITVLAPPEADQIDALRQLAEAVKAGPAPARPAIARPDVPTRGAIDSATIAQTVAALLPENAIVCDEAVTTGRSFFPPTHAARPHDWLALTGGSIGLGIPMATGAAVACPDRKVVNLQADGSGLYTAQALWTQARENLDVLTVIFANRSYAILRGELAGVGANPGRKALDMLSLDNPAIDWVSLARGFGVEALQAADLDAFVSGMRIGLGRRGPFLIEALL